MSLFWRSSIGVASPFWGATTKIGKSTDYTGFMTSASGSMELSQCGSSLPTFSCICLCRLSLRMKCLVFMEDFPLRSSNWTRLKASIGSKISHTMVPCVTCCGQIPQTKGNQGSDHRPVVLVSAGARTSVTSSTIATTSRWYAEPTSWSWTATTTPTRRNASPFSQRPTIVTAVEIAHRY